MPEVNCGVEANKPNVRQYRDTLQAVGWVVAFELDGLLLVTVFCQVTDQVAEK